MSLFVANMTAATAAPVISSNDRISFTLLLAVAAHALIILGLGFELARQSAAAPSTIEVILTKTQNVDTPKDAQVIAEHNQIQSGSVDHDARPSSPSVTQKSFQGSDQRSSQAIPENSTYVAQDEQVVSKNSTKGQQVSQPVTTQRPSPLQQHELQRNQQNVARLVSELRKEKQLYAKRPRINHIDTLSAKSAIEAKYIKDWVEKVEIIGNINYPSQARQQKLSGTLILSVLVNSDGRVLSSTIQQSSGKKLLDEASKKVVRLSSPFKQFPQEMREQYDQLMITRTWIYHNNRKLTTQ